MLSTSGDSSSLGMLLFLLLLVMLSVTTLHDYIGLFNYIPMYSSLEYVVVVVLFGLMLLLVQPIVGFVPNAKLFPSSWICF